MFSSCNSAPFSKKFTSCKSELTSYKSDIFSQNHELITQSLTWFPAIPCLYLAILSSLTILTFFSELRVYNTLLISSRSLNFKIAILNFHLAIDFLCQNSKLTLTSCNFGLTCHNSNIFHRLASLRHKVLTLFLAILIISCNCKLTSHNSDRDA